MAFRIVASKNRVSGLVRFCYQNHNKFCGTLNRGVHLSASNWKRVAFHLSDIGEGIREVIVKEWFVKEGDVVQQFDDLCEVQSDKASVTITSRYDGKILRLHHSIDDIALVGKPLIDFDVSDDPSESSSSSESSSDSSDSDRAEEKVKNEEIAKQSTGAAAETINAAFNKMIDDQRKTLATPAVRRIARENNVNLADVAPSGRFGNVLKSDVLQHLNVIPPVHENNRPKPIVEKQVAPRITKETAKEGDRVEKLKDVRKIMFKTMTESLKIPHFTYSDEVNVTSLVEIRNSLKEDAETLGVKLTFMPFFIKAASLALSKYPILNSSVDESTESIIYKSSHNISIAMATKIGLVVPNVKNCEQKSIIQIARDLNALLERGRNGRLVPDDFANGTFSLSNIGIIGGTYTSPVIASPQVAIGAIGTTQIVPKFVGDSDVVQRAHIINVSWSADHRVIDGVTMAGFSNEWKRYIENPNRLILQ